MAISRGGETNGWRAALRGRNRDPDPGVLCQRAALLGSGAQEASRFKRAAVALVRKLAVVLHVMWKTRKNFDPTTGSLPERDHRSHDLITWDTTRHPS